MGGALFSHYPLLITVRFRVTFLIIDIFTRECAYALPALVHSTRRDHQR